jgi:hypothetical protein
MFHPDLEKGKPCGRNAPLGGGQALWKEWDAWRARLAVETAGYASKARLRALS